MKSGHTNYFNIYSTYKITTYNMITLHVYFYFVFCVCVFRVREGSSDAIFPLMHRISLSPFHPHTWCFTWSFTVPLQVQMVTDYSKPIQSESVFTSVLCWQASYYKLRVIFSIDGIMV